MRDALTALALVLVSALIAALGVVLLWYWWLAPLLTSFFGAVP